MKKLLLTTASVIAISFAATAQTETPPATQPPTTTETPPPATDGTATPPPTDGSVATEVPPVVLDSLGNPIAVEPAAPAAPAEKPSSRLKKYSGKHRGNNVIYDPK